MRASKAVERIETVRRLLVYVALAAVVVSLVLTSCLPTDDRAHRQPTESPTTKGTPTDGSPARREGHKNKCRFNDTTGIYDPFVASECVGFLRTIPWDSIRILHNRPNEPVFITISDDIPSCLGLYFTNGLRGRNGPVVTVVGGPLKRKNLCKRGAIPEVFKTYLSHTPKSSANVIDGSTIPKRRRQVRIEARRRARRLK